MKEEKQKDNEKPTLVFVRDKLRGLIIKPFKKKAKEEL